MGVTNLQIISQISITTGLRLGPYYIDTLGISLNICVLIIAIFPFFNVFFAQYFGRDTLTIGCTYVYDCDGYAKYFVYTMRVTYIIPAIELMRLFPLGICIFAIGIHIILGIMSYLEENSGRIAMSRIKSLEILRIYNYLEIILQVVHEVSSTAASVLMILGLLLSVTLNFLTVKMRSVLPMPYYLVCPVSAGIIPVVIQILLPLAISIFENAEALLQSWRVEVRHSCDRRYLRRRLKTCKAVTVYAGLFKFNFYHLCVSTKSTFCYAIVDYTITALLWT